MFDLKRVLNILFVICIVGCIYFCFIIYTDSSFVEKIIFLDVGQGDSQLIMTKQGKVLIDGGPSKNIVYTLANVLPFSDRVIDILVLTHTDYDHLNGFNYVLDYYDVKLIFLSDVGCVKTSCIQFFKKIQELNIPVVLGTSESKIVLGEDMLDFVYPKISDLGQIKNSNNYSIINLFRTKEGNILFTGDVEKNILKSMVLENNIKDIDILKAPHHGAKNGVDDFILKYVNPRDVVIEVGDNNYGHPSKEVVD